MTKDEALRMALEAIPDTIRLMQIYIEEQAGPYHSEGQRASLTGLRTWRGIESAIREVLAQPEGCQCPACKITTHASDCAVHSAPAYPIGKCDCGAQPEYSATSDHRLMEMPEFTRHEVESAEDWSEWVCPDPKSYLMKCCDCGLVHEAQFGVVRYKSETEREDCDMVDDPNLQAVFRMRRSEQWTPEDRAYRPGGLPMEQPSKPWVGLTDAEREKLRWQALEADAGYTQLIKETEAKLREKNT